MLLFAFRGRFKTLKGILVNVNVDGVVGGGGYNRELVGNDIRGGGYGSGRNMG